MTDLSTVTRDAIRQRALQTLRERHTEEYEALLVLEWARVHTPVIATTEAELRAALTQPEPFYAEAT